MKPIRFNLPNLSNDQLCTPSNTPNQYYCFYNFYNMAYHDRCTAVFVNGEYVCATKQNNQYGYDVSQYPTAIYSVEAFPELAYFWFPVISSILVGLIFYLIYKIIFSRFIK